MADTRLTRRRVLAAGSTLALGGCLGQSGGGSTDSGSDAESDTGTSTAVSTAPLPDDPRSHTYARMGTEEADALATYYGSWKCPYCAEFSVGFLPTLVTDYVVPGNLAIEFRSLAYFGGKPFLGEDAPAATRAGLAVWNAEPETYWPYHEYVFANQPSENEQWATADRLVSFAEAAGVESTDAVRTAVERRKYEKEMQATAADAEAAGIQGTPTLVVGGQTVSPFDEEKTRTVIENAIES